MSDLKAKFEAKLLPRPTRFESWIEEQSEDDRDAILEYATSELSTKAFIELLRDELGAHVNAETVAAWRKIHGYVAR